ncbi:MAG: ABC transporter ATP-binding protein [Chloroflexota bacterium]|nr:ABC transporter ATP-binding protein [Chloroflexota bacterium]
MSDAPAATPATKTEERTPLLSVRNLERVYHLGEQTIHALRPLNLDIHNGDFIAIAGPSGSGKSTLLQLLGLVDSPTAGEVRIRNQIAQDLGREQRAALRLKTLGFVFQAFNLLQMLTARQNVEIALTLAGFPRRKRRQRAEELLSAVGLAERLEHRPLQLSGGERQRVAIARALANEPDVILADEPTGNLDSQTGREIVNLLEDLNRAGQTIVMVTHNLEIARRAGRLFLMRDGRIDEVDPDVPDSLD